MEGDLFANDPVLNAKPRDKFGRYATPERARADKAIEENKYLRLQVEKFKRAWFAASEMSSMYHRALIKAKEELRELRQKAAAL